MGISINGYTPKGFGINGTNVKGIAYNGQIIWQAKNIVYYKTNDSLLPYFDPERIQDTDTVGFRIYKLQPDYLWKQYNFYLHGSEVANNDFSHSGSGLNIAMKEVPEGSGQYQIVSTDGSIIKVTAAIVNGQAYRDGTVAGDHRDYPDPYIGQYTAIGQRYSAGQRFDVRTIDPKGLIWIKSYIDRRILGDTGPFWLVFKVWKVDSFMNGGQIWYNEYEFGEEQNGHVNFGSDGFFKTSGPKFHEYQEIALNVSGSNGNLSINSTSSNGGGYGYFDPPTVEEIWFTHINQVPKATKAMFDSWHDIIDPPQWYVSE